VEDFVNSFTITSSKKLQTACNSLQTVRVFSDFWPKNAGFVDNYALPCGFANGAFNPLFPSKIPVNRRFVGALKNYFQILLFVLHGNSKCETIGGRYCLQGFSREKDFLLIIRVSLLCLVAGGVTSKSGLSWRKTRAIT
jgi:hypothetical protein